MQQHSAQFLDNADTAISDSQAAQKRDLLAIFAPLMRDAAVDGFSAYEATRQHVKRVRRHSLDNLAHYLAQFEQQAVGNGNRVHFARNADEMNSIALDICQQHGAQHVAKGKSMVTEETGLNDFLQRAGLHVVETDLGEYIIQQAGETPSHIVGPALHKSGDDIRALFLERHQLGERQLDDTTALVDEARNVLRPQFLQADVGIIGANALIAENGYSMLVTNEGNGDLCANLPRVLIVCTTIDRVLPRAEDATAMLRLLVRSATGQAQTCYTSFYSGPRRAQDTDGPLETHFVLLDNQRSDILDSGFREMLDCIRCGACLNHCPIYTSVGLRLGLPGAHGLRFDTAADFAGAEQRTTECLHRLWALRRGVPRGYSPARPVARSARHGKPRAPERAALAAGYQPAELAGGQAAPVSRTHRRGYLPAAPHRTQARQLPPPAAGWRLDQPAGFSRARRQDIHAAV